MLKSKMYTVRMLEKFQPIVSRRDSICDLDVNFERCKSVPKSSLRD